MTKAPKKHLFPGYRFGPNDEMELFQREEDVPQGWTRIHPANRVIEDKPKPRPTPAKRGTA